MVVVEAFVTAVRRDNFVAGVCLHIGHQHDWSSDYTENDAADHACNVVAWFEKPYMAQLLVVAVVVEGFYYSYS